MRYRPEWMPGLLSNEEEMRFWLIGTGFVVIAGVIGLTVYGLIKFLVFIF